MKKLPIFILFSLLAACAPLNVSPQEIAEEAKPLVSAATSNLAEKIGVPEQEITVVSVQRKTWSDSSLGCPAPGGFYAQVRTSGYRIVLQAGGKRYSYHAADGGKTLLLCER